MVGYQLHASDLGDVTHPRLMCSKCTFLVRDAMALPASSRCDHRFCGSCLEAMSVDGHGTAICPLDGENLCEAVPDEAVQRKVLSHIVYCTFREIDVGCSWEGKLEHLEKHIEMCHSEGDAASKARSQTEVPPFQPNASDAKRQMGALVVERPPHGDDLLHQLKLLQTPINNNWLGAHCAYIASGGLPSTTSVDDGQSPLAIPGPSGVNVPGAEPQRARPKENDQQTQQQPSAFIASGGLPSTTSVDDGQTPLAIPGPSGVNVPNGAEPQMVGPTENDQQTQQQPSAFIASGGLPSTTSVDDGQSPLAIPGPSGVNVPNGAEPQMVGPTENDQQTQQQPSAFIASGGLPSTTSVDDGQSPLAIPGPSGVNVPNGAEPQMVGPTENDQQTQQQPSAFIASGGLPSTTSVDDGQSPLAIPGPSGVNVPNGAEPQMVGPTENDQQTQQQEELDQLKWELDHLKMAFERQQSRIQALEQHRGPLAHVWEENEKLKIQLASERQHHERQQEQWQARLQRLEQQLAVFDEKRDRERALENEKQEREQQLEAQRNRFESHNDECLKERKRAFNDGGMQANLMLSHIQKLQDSHVSLQSSHANLQERVRQLEGRGSGSNM